MADRDVTLVGRQAVLSILATARQRVTAGAPETVLIEGEPGIGKSAVLEAFASATPARDAVLWLRGDAFERDIAFAATARVLGERDLDTTEVEAGRRLLARLVSEPATPSGAVVLLVDDAQWVDRSSALALRYALRQLRSEPVLTVLARRPPVVPDPVEELIDETVVTEVVHLEPLQAAEVVALAGRFRSWALSVEVAERLVQRTGGVPLLVAAVLRDAASPGDLETSVVPASVGTAAGRMMSVLSTPALRLVEASAVMDEPIDLIPLAQVAEVAEPWTAYESATAAGLLAAAPDRTVECAHDLLRDAIYARIPAVRRRGLHARAAELTGGDRRLAHRVAAAQHPDPELVGDLLTAADEARGLGRYALAARQRLMARSVCAAAELREECLLEAVIDRVQALDLTGAQDLAAPAQETSRSARRSLALGLLARELGRVGPARTLLDEAIKLARGHEPVVGSRAGLALAELMIRLNEGAAALSVLDGIVGDPDSAGAHGPEDAEPSDRVAVDATALRCIALWQTGSLTEALGLLGSEPAAVSGTAAESSRLAVRGLIRLYAGDLTGALADLDATVRLEHLWRPSTNQTRTYVLRSIARFHLGDWDGSADDAAAARAVAELEAGARTWSLALAHAQSVPVPAGRGHWDVAEEHLEEARSGLATLTSPAMIAAIAESEALLAGARGDHARVIAALDPVVTEAELARSARIRAFRGIVAARIEACVELGRLDEAADDLDRYASMVRQWPGGPQPARISWLRGRLAEARRLPQQAYDHYVVELADPAVAAVPFVLGQTLLRCGRLERVLGRRRRAVERLSQARRVFDHLGAVPYRRRCDEELAACGLRSSTTDPLSLSDRERDVAVLVARGYSNKEVAAELFLTTKAVEFHLQNIYVKLGVANRRELRQQQPSL